MARADGGVYSILRRPPILGVKDNKDKRDAKIFDMWLACHTQEEIAETTGVARKTIDDWLSGFGDFGKLAESAKATASHAIDFDPPIYNVWKQQEKTPGSKHFGNSEVRSKDR